MSSVQCPSCKTQLAADARFCGACGTTVSAQTPALDTRGWATPPPRTPETLIGRTLGGRYKILAKLGQGGMGTVFRAEQVSVKRKIALKVLDPSLSLQPELIRRFQAEAEVVARLSHPHIVTLFDFGQAEDGLLFIAMELAEGKSLRDVVAQEAPLAPARALDIAEQVASSLADAHAHGVVHRDLKPDNVMLSDRAGRRDFARVLDFGIAKLRDDPTGSPMPTMTRAGQLLGTPAYMSPEQILGAAVDSRTDVYALGCMLFEMLTGRLPFEAQSPLAILAKHLNDRPMTVEQARPGLAVPPGLSQLILACMEKDPALRPQDMALVGAHLAALKAQLGHLVVVATVPTPPPGAGAMGTPPPLALPLATPNPVAIPPPHAGAAPQPPPAPSPGQRRLVTLLGGVLMGALLLGGGVWVLTHQPESKVIEILKQPPAPSPPKPPTVTGPPVKYTSDVHGYTIDLPAGFSMDEDDDTGVGVARGPGGVSSISVIPAPGGQDADSRVAQISAATNRAAIIRERRTRRIGGKDLVSIIYDLDAMGSRFETVFYPRAPVALAVTYATSRSIFDDTAGVREALFRDGFNRGGPALHAPAAPPGGWNTEP